MSYLDKAATYYDDNDMKQEFLSLIRQRYWALRKVGLSFIGLYDAILLKFKLGLVDEIK